MTGGSGPGAGIWRQARVSGRAIAWAVLRVVASIAVVVALYYLLPFDRSSTGVVVTLLVAGLVVFVGRLIKNNQARPVRRMVHWYDVQGQVHDVKVLHHARQKVKPEKR